MNFFSVKFHHPIVMVLFFILGLVSCKNKNSEDPSSTPKNSSAVSELQENRELFFKLSLAQWSLHKQINSGELDPMNFAQKANELGFEGIEYVNSFYAEKIKNSEDKETAMQDLLVSLKAKSEEFDIRNLLIMIDGEGELAVTNEKERSRAIENHKKWIDAAAFLGCHSIRVNLFGSHEPEKWQTAAVDALTKLSEYAAGKNINVLVENHGYLSSNAKLLVEVMERVDLPNCGTLPDFGNFCLRREGGERWGAKCAEEYPRYKGVEEMMPYAKAVSAKSYDFDEDGKETTIDYSRMLKIIKDAGYTGFVGVEYEGENLSEEEGIVATKELLIEVGSKFDEETRK